MYLEKDYLIKKIDEYCKYRNIELTYEEKDFLSSQVSRKLDNERLLTFEEFTELLDHNEHLEQYSDIEFNDEIVSIEEIGEMELIDFDVSGNHLFYADGILTHNSATNNIDEADNSNVSDSMGTVMTADFMMFLLQNEEMKEKKEIVCKITKNRFAGRTDTWLMNIDYEHMRFSDMLIQNAGTDIDITDTLGLDKTNTVDSDFGIITAKKQEDAETFANKEVKDILHDDINKVIESDKASKDPFNNDLDALYADLGL